MIKELQNPEHKTYWIAYSDDKKVVHYGITETNQVTTTGLDNFEFDTDKQKLLSSFGGSFSKAECDLITDAFEAYMDSNGKGVIS